MKRAVIVCPGRGTYNASELGTLTKHFPGAELLARFDDMRAALGQQSLTALDTAPRFDAGTHTRGDNASALIFASGFGDWLSLDPEKVEIVAVTGNSMGWYTALACSGAVSPETGFDIANTMGTFMQASMVGGQVVQPHCGDDWVPDHAEKRRIFDFVDDIDRRADHLLACSIDLGGMLVVAGNDAGLKAFAKAVPQREPFPLKLRNHAAFHTRLMAPVSRQGLERFSTDVFAQPIVPMIDGRGAIWWPHATEESALRDYTLCTQVIDKYNFTSAIRVAAQEFAPDLFIVLGPGDTLGSSVVQSLIEVGWFGLGNKTQFQSAQSVDPVLVAMARPEQRALVA